jgi:hypothetical protein
MLPSQGLVWFGIFVLSHDLAGADSLMMKIPSIFVNKINGFYESNPNV